MTCGSLKRCYKVGGVINFFSSLKEMMQLCFLILFQGFRGHVSATVLLNL